MTQMDDRNFPWHLGFENKFYARITNSGEMCVGFRLFPATVFLVEYFWARFKEIPFWMKRAIVKNFMILLFLFSLYFWINALFHIASTFDPTGCLSRTHLTNGLKKKHNPWHSNWTDMHTQICLKNEKIHRWRNYSNQ